MDRTPAGVRFSGGGRDLGRVALQLTSVTGHAGLGAGSLTMLERLPNPSPPRARPQILDQGFSPGDFTPGHIWRGLEAFWGVSTWLGAKDAANHCITHRTTATTENYPNIQPQKSIGLRLGDPGLDGLDVAQPGLERPPNKADAPSGAGAQPCQGLVGVCVSVGMHAPMWYVHTYPQIQLEAQV